MAPAPITAMQALDAVMVTNDTVQVCEKTRRAGLDAGRA
jgi:hypothetical protein